MKQIRKNETLLVHWVYPLNEWSRFRKWSAGKKGLFYYLFYFLNPAKRRKPAEVKITPNRICINESEEPISFSKFKFRGVEIYEAMDINIFEIGYFKNGKIKIIQVPIPKGKLKEAIKVQSELNNNL